MAFFGLTNKKPEKTYLKSTHFYTFYHWVTDIFKQLQEEGNYSRKWLEHHHDRITKLESSHIQNIHQNHKNTEEVSSHLANLQEEHKKAREDLHKTQELIRSLYNQQKDTLSIISALKSEHNKIKEQISQSVTHDDMESVIKRVTMTQNTRKSPSIKEANNNKMRATEHLRDTHVSHDVTQMTRDTRHSVSHITNLKNQDNRASEINIVSIIQDLNISEKRITYLLIHSKIGLNYGQIAEKLAMNYSTVKNIIYRLRKKKIPILDNISRKGEKEFYLPENLKIALKTQE